MVELLCEYMNELLYGYTFDFLQQYSNTTI